MAEIIGVWQTSQVSSIQDMSASQFVIDRSAGDLWTKVRVQEACSGLFGPSDATIMLEKCGVQDSLRHCMHDDGACATAHTCIEGINPDAHPGQQAYTAMSFSRHCWARTLVYVVSQSLLTPYMLPGQPCSL